MQRIDIYPQAEYKGYKLRIGKPMPFGASIVPGGVNFSVFSRHAVSCDLVLYRNGEDNPFVIIPFPPEFRIGDVFTMTVFGLDYESIEYGYRVDGKFDAQKGDRFIKDYILLDPYAKSISGRNVWGAPVNINTNFQYRGRIISDDYNWERDKPLKIPMEDLVIYEMHVRSFTKHKSSRSPHPGTFAGVVDKIPYLKQLGVNCVELMPIFAFDEMDNSHLSDTGERLLNLWGYSTVGFFAPKAGYASTGKFNMEADEMKNMIKQLHKNGIEVILDVVFNHTAEGNENGPIISFKGLDNRTYYLLTPDGKYHNFSGCGNTFNCNNTVVRTMILDCLRYWISEFHIDGFRFDLAAILSRDENGVPMDDPPLLELLAHDPILAQTKLIAEAWDAGGLYQVGEFSDQPRWAEWNGKYRDDIRRFLKGDCLPVNVVCDRITGSPSLYQTRGANASVNFITCHDGFTLNDMVSYNWKHNEKNGEGNKDGCDDNKSWNCGAEGETDDININRLRIKQIKNAVTILLMSRGIPMLLSGDEFCNSQHGNNNAYCQDNPISWLNWDDLSENIEVFKYFKKMIAFRKEHPVLRNPKFDDNENSTGYPEVSWHQQKPWQVDSTSSSLTLALLYAESAQKYNLTEDTFIYFIMNMHWEQHKFELPVLPEGFKWHYAASTDTPGNCFFEKEIEVSNQKAVILKERSTMILVGKKVVNKKAAEILDQ